MAGIIEAHCQNLAGFAGNQNSDVSRGERAAGQLRTVEQPAAELPDRVVLKQTVRRALIVCEANKVLVRRLNIRGHGFLLSPARFAARRVAWFCQPDSEPGAATRRQLAGWPGQCLEGLCTDATRRLALPTYPQPPQRQVLCAA
jgi:hypothetical protein